MATETVETETQSMDASTDTTVIIPITGAIYHNGNEKPTERWCFELGMRVATDKDFTSVLICLRKGFRITVDFILLWPRQFASLLGTWQLYSRFDSPIVKKANHIGCLQMKFANTLRTSKATSQVMNSI